MSTDMMKTEEAPLDYGDNDPYAPPVENKSRFPVIGNEVTRLTEKVIIPVDEYPRYNFVGKLLGPKGSTLKGLQATVKAKMSILGRGSTRDKKKEEELIKSEDPQYEHLKEPLHVLISVQAPRIEAHRRVAAALKEVYKFMVPELEDAMPEQMDERGYVKDPERGPSSSNRGGAPIIRVGIPPPGAFVLGDQPPRGGGRRGGGSGGSNVGQGGAYGYDRYGGPQDEYSENRGNYENTGFSRGLGKRSAPPANGIQQKRYRDSL